MWLSSSSTLLSSTHKFPFFHLKSTGLQLSFQLCACYLSVWTQWGEREGVSCVAVALYSTRNRNVKETKLWTLVIIWEKCDPWETNEKRDSPVKIERVSKYELTVASLCGSVYFCTTACCCVWCHVIFLRMQVTFRPRTIHTEVWLNNNVNSQPKKKTDLGKKNLNWALRPVVWT